jgi:superfamily II DNA/RNA helicase
MARSYHAERSGTRWGQCIVYALSTETGICARFRVNLLLRPGGRRPQPCDVGRPIHPNITGVTITPTTFDALGVSPKLVSVLGTLGITTPLPVQQLTIPDALAGRDVCGKAKTGSGKTLAFGLPLLERTPKGKPGRPAALVLVPTRELAVQVREVLAPLAQAADRTVAAVYGGTPMDRQIKAARRRNDIVVATPGRLIDLVGRRDISLESVEMLVLDEADRMVDMGFLPQVVWLLSRIPGKHQTMLFSATLSTEVSRLVRDWISDPVHHEVESPQPTVEAMEHRFLKVHELDKVKVAAAVAGSVGRTLLFVRTKHGADRLAKQLARDGVRAGVLHGGLTQSARQRALDRFRSDPSGLLVATDVAARGLDVDGIDVVIHFDPPEDHTAYLHRSGRTARAGEEGVAVSLVLWDQELESERLRRRLGIRQPLVEVFSNDARLKDLLSPEWSLAPDAATGTDGSVATIPPTAGTRTAGTRARPKGAGGRRPGGSRRRR